MKRARSSLLLFILVMVTILGITPTNTSTLELQIASNDQFIKMAFYNRTAPFPVRPN
jgi:Tfp pilus assembly protein PilX